MRKLSLLDCTLSSGIRFTGRCFDEDAVTEIPRQLLRADVEVIMLGTLKDEPTETGKALFRSMEEANELIAEQSTRVKYAVSIDIADPLSVNKISPASLKGVTVVQVCIPADRVDEGVVFCKALAEKGYELFVRPLCASRYCEEAFVEMIERFNSLMPSAFYISDDWGTCNTPELMTYIRIAAQHLRSEIALGYHGHNNMLQALDVAKAFCEFDTERDIYIDASIDGIGHDAGNLDIGSIAAYLNRKYNKNFVLPYFWDLSARYIQPIRAKFPCGYSAAYYLTAIYNCNPNYGAYYDYDMHMPIEEIEGVIQSISAEDRIIYSKKKALSYLRAYRKKKLRMVVIVVTANRHLNVGDFLEKACKSLYEHGIDLVVYDSSSTEQTEIMVKNYQLKKYDNLYYDRYTGYFNGRTIDEKVITAYEKYSQLYDYIWVCKDNIIPYVDKIYPQLVRMAEQRIDMCACISWIRSEQPVGIKKYSNNALEFFRENCVQMTGLGNTIFQSAFLQDILQKVPLDENKNIGLWQPICVFQYIAEHEFTAFQIIDYVNELNKYAAKTTSFWNKQGNFLWQWADRWYTMITALPPIYNPAKKEVLKIEMVDFHPFSYHFLFTVRSNNGLTLGQIRQYRDTIPKVTKEPIHKLYVVALLPKLFTRYLVNHFDGKLAKGLNKLKKLLRV